MVRSIKVGILYMKRSSTLFLKGVICLVGIAVFGICIIVLGVSFSGNAGVYLPMMIVMLVTALPFFLALYQGLLFLSNIEKNIAFSESSARAIQKITYCAFTISALYGAAMPLIIRAAEKDDAPGVVLIGLLCIFVPLVTGVFASVLEKLLRSAIEIKSGHEVIV
jgi:hypothetical protein